MKHIIKTSMLLILVGSFAVTGCDPEPNQTNDSALFSLFSDKPAETIETNDSAFVITTSSPDDTGCKIDVTTTTAPSTAGSVTPGQVITFEMQGADAAHVENSGIIEGIYHSIQDLPAKHSIVAPDVTTKYVLSVFTVDGVRTRNNNCEVTVNVIPSTVTTAPEPSCQISFADPIGAYGSPLTINWTSQNAVSAEIYPAKAVGVIAPADVASGSWSYKSYYGNEYSMKVWNADGVWAECFPGQLGSNSTLLDRANVGIDTWDINLPLNTTASERINGGSSFAHSPANWITVSDADCSANGVDGFINCPFTGNVIGVCSIRYYISSGQIVDSTLVMLKSYQESTSVSDADKQSVFTHEVGHCLGLQHSDSSNDIMYFSTAGADTPSTAELDAVQAAYNPIAAPTGAAAARFGATSSGSPIRQYSLPTFYISATIGNGFSNAEVTTKGQALTGDIAERTYYIKSDGNCESH